MSARGLLRIRAVCLIVLDARALRNRRAADFRKRLGNATCTSHAGVVCALVTLRTFLWGRECVRTAELLKLMTPTWAAAVSRRLEGSRDSDHQGPCPGPTPLNVLHGYQDCLGHRRLNPPTESISSCVDREGAHSPSPLRLRCDQQRRGPCSMVRLRITTEGDACDV